jgi:antitoxin (DNA-binding transcriptional repressor) of toxin-antitoxin stability system
MRAVGIRELKNRLSEYLRAVREGECVYVTDRGRVIAELRPPGAAAAPPGVPPGLLELARQGRVRLGLPNHPAAYPPSPLRLPDGTAQQLIDEDRGER